MIENLKTNDYAGTTRFVEFHIPCNTDETYSFTDFEALFLEQDSRLLSNAQKMALAQARQFYAKPFGESILKTLVKAVFNGRFSIKKINIDDDCLKSERIKCSFFRLDTENLQKP